MVRCQWPHQGAGFHCMRHLAQLDSDDDGGGDVNLIVMMMVVVVVMPIHGLPA